MTTTPISTEALAKHDFLLCNPRLPRMAQAICVYFIVLAPTIWLFQTFWGFAFLFAYANELPKQVVGMGLLAHVVGVFLTAPFVILTATGGLMLRKLRAFGGLLIVLSASIGLVICSVGGLWLMSQLHVAQMYEKFANDPHVMQMAKEQLVWDTVGNVESCVQMIWEFIAITWLVFNLKRLWKIQRECL